MPVRGAARQRRAIRRHRAVSIDGARRHSMAAEASSVTSSNVATTGSAVSEKFQDSTRNMITTSSRDARARSRAGCLSGWTAATGGEFASTRAAIVKSP